MTGMTDVPSVIPIEHGPAYEKWTKAKALKLGTVALTGFWLFFVAAKVGVEAGLGALFNRPAVDATQNFVNTLTGGSELANSVMAGSVLLGALGVLTVWALSGRPAFTHHKDFDTVERIEEGQHYQPMEIVETEASLAA